MKLIERPPARDWQFHNDGIHWTIKVIHWWEEHLKDHYAIHKDDLVRVYSLDKDGFTVREIHDAQSNHISKYQAYLIKSSIEPIKKETAEDVLRELIDKYESGDILSGRDTWEYLKTKKRILEES